MNQNLNEKPFKEETNALQFEPFFSIDGIYRWPADYNQSENILCEALYWRNKYEYLEEGFLSVEEQEKIQGWDSVTILK